MFPEFALTHAWLIPLLPAVAFLIIGGLTRQNKNTSAVIAIAFSSLSFLLAVGVLLAVIRGPIVMADPFVMKTLWAKIGHIELAMGVLVDPLTAMMLMVVTTVSLLVQIY